MLQGSRMRNQCRSVAIQRRASQSFLTWVDDATILLTCKSVSCLEQCPTRASCQSKAIKACCIGKYCLTFPRWHNISIPNVTHPFKVVKVLALTSCVLSTLTSRSTHLTKFDLRCNCTQYYCEDIAKNLVLGTR